jgi:hypothetical protein
LNRNPFIGNTILPIAVNPASQQILALLPAANQPGFANNLLGGVRLLDDTHRMDGKLDHRFSERSTGYFRYGFTTSSIDQGSLLGVLGNPSNAEFRGTNAVGSFTQLFSTNLLAEFRFGYDRYRNNITPWGDFSGLQSLSPFGFANGLPSINISGFSPLGFAPNALTKQVDNIYDGATDWFAHTGMHSIKFGIGVRELQTNGFNNAFFSPTGSFIFGQGATLNSTAAGANQTAQSIQANSFAGFLVGAASQSGVSVFQTTPAFHQRQYDAYITDTINLFRKVYLEIGVRYDIFNPIRPTQAGGAVAYDPTTNTNIALGAGGNTSNYTRTDVNNVAPRIGLAFRPVSRFVFRGGYGLDYFPTPIGLSNINPLAFGVQNGVAGGLTTTSFTVPPVPTTLATSVNQPYFVTSRSIGTPYVQSFNGMLQGELGHGFLLDIGYVGALGRQLPFQIPLVGVPGSGLAGLPVFGRTAAILQRGDGLTSNYNSLQVNLTKKFSNGILFTGAYTYGKALDYGFALLDPYNTRNNYGPANWDRRHILTISHVWRVPFGPGTNHFNHGIAAQVLGNWELNGILRWSTGTPYTVTADPLACACLGVSAVPAQFLGGNSLDGSSSFNPASFSAPAPGTLGALSRNAIRGPDLFNYNLALFRNFPIKENIKLELRGEVYNLTNTSNYSNPVANFASPGFGNTLGSVDGLAGRQFQVAARILF